MLKFTKFALALSLTCCLLQQVVLADPVIELDNKDLSHCLQQLESVSDMFPVILGYATHCPYAQAFLPTYRDVANSEKQKHRAFFQFDYDNSDRTTAQKCLGLDAHTALVSPQVTVVIQIPDQETGQTIRSMPIHSWGGAKVNPEDPSKPLSISPQELEHIIYIGPEELLLKKQLLIKPSKIQRG